MLPHDVVRCCRAFHLRRDFTILLHELAAALACRFPSKTDLVEFGDVVGLQRSSLLQLVQSPDTRHPGTQFWVFLALLRDLEIDLVLRFELQQARQQVIEVHIEINILQGMECETEILQPFDLDFTELVLDVQATQRFAEPTLAGAQRNVGMSVLAFVFEERRVDLRQDGRLEAGNAVISGFRHCGVGGSHSALVVAHGLQNAISRSWPWLKRRLSMLILTKRIVDVVRMQWQR
mmetsp:Transcript_880/g.2505  ORF Transcript_880/g.2505 Transcript_880/m.2505 type:complete len:234 (-) Transcript_880:213-914(-)